MCHMPGSAAEAQQWNIVCEVFVWKTDGLCEWIPNISASCADLWTCACVSVEGVYSHFHWHTPHYSDRLKTRPGWHGSTDNAVFVFSEWLNMSLLFLFCFWKSLRTKLLKKLNKYLLKVLTSLPGFKVTFSSWWVEHFLDQLVLCTIRTVHWIKSLPVGGKKYVSKTKISEISTRLCLKHKSDMLKYLKAMSSQVSISPQLWNTVSKPGC